MTIWVLKIIEDILHEYKKNPVRRMLTRIFNFVNNPRLANFGWIKVSDGSFGENAFLPSDLVKKVYPTFAYFTNDQCSYHYSNADSFWHDEVNDVYFGYSEKSTSVILDGEEKTTSLAYAKSKHNNGWFWDEEKERYTNTLPDYPAYNPRYKYSPRNWPEPAKEEVYGHEWELKFPSYAQKLKFAEAVKATHKPCITEKDGSLDGGAADGPSLELITPPWSFNDSLTNLAQLARLARKNNGLGHKAGTGYAWHITLNLLSAKDPIKAGSRFCCLINHPRLRKFWQLIARRQSSYNHENDKEYARFEDMTVEDALHIPKWEHRWAKKPVDHYYATFFRKGGKAVELRILRSTLNIDTITATMHLVRSAWLFAQTDLDIHPRQWYNWLEDKLHPAGWGLIQKVGADQQLISALIEKKAVEIVEEEV